VKAMILAAGRGERLRPLSDRLPKALAPAGGRPLVAWLLERLAGAGFRDVVINVSHLGAQIEAQLGDGAAFGLAIASSRAGGIAHARALLGSAPFLLANADVYSDYDLRGLRTRALGNCLAHLVLAPNPAHHPGGDFSLAGGFAGNAPSPRYTYTGMALVDPALIAPVRAGSKAPIAPLLRAAADAGRLSGELYSGLWRDIGTAQRLEELDALVRARMKAGT
jgi:N-acetyl-alpha-D-muramate 1-phosphate uridylyltransferase